LEELQTKKQGGALHLKSLLMFALFLISFSVLQAHLSKPKITISSSKKTPTLHFIPEHKRTAEKILLTIPSQENNEHFRTLVKNVYEALLISFPSYSTFEITVSESNLLTIKKIISKNNLQNRTTYHITEDEKVSIEAWAQDYFEPALSSNKTNIFLLPTTKSEKQPSRASGNFSQRSFARNESLSKTVTNLAIKEVDFFFEGGNVIVAENQSQQLLILVDYTSVTDSFSKNTLSKAADALSKGFGETKIGIIGNTQRINNFIHLDQSVLLLPNGIVFVNKITGFPKSSAARQHKTYTKQLKQLGFKVITIDTTNDDVEKSRSSLNAIPFFDKQENKEKVIFPVFENELKNKDLKDLSKSNLSGKALQMYEELEKLDTQPIPLLDQNLFQNNAGYHCLVNVLR